MPLLVVVGYGPGVSRSTAERFAREGWSIALVGRTRERLDDGARRLEALGVRLSTHQADASSTEQITTAIEDIRRRQGPIGAVLWTAFRSGAVRDVLETEPDAVGRVFDVGVLGLLAVVRAARADLIATAGSVLVVNGAVGDPTAAADRVSTMLGIDGTALENAAKSKLVGILAERLRPEGVHVGQITIAGSVRGTETASATAIDPALIAERFWAMTRAREQTREVVVERPAD